MLLISLLYKLIGAILTSASSPLTRINFFFFFNYFSFSVLSIQKVWKKEETCQDYVCFPALFKLLFVYSEEYLPLCASQPEVISSSNGCVWTPAAGQEADKFFLLICVKSAERFSVSLDQLVEWLPTEFYLWNWCGIMFGESSSNTKTMGIYREGKIFPELIPCPAGTFWPFLWHCPYSAVNIIEELKVVFLLHPEMLDVKQNKCEFWYVAR